MQSQNYKNHIKYYLPHHVVLLPVMFAALVISVVHIFTHPAEQVMYIWLSIVFFFMLCIAIMLRQHYALGNQNRIVRLEMRLRYYQLTGARFEPLEQQLTFGQLAALRFAPDDELPGLLQRAISENLSPKAIKQSVKNWQGDYMRV